VRSCRQPKGCIVTTHWVFNHDFLMGYLYGGFTLWAFARNRWMTLAAVSLVVLFGLAADIPGDFL
jgi:hypothetical protein